MLIFGKGAHSTDSGHLIQGKSATCLGWTAGQAEAPLSAVGAEMGGAAGPSVHKAGPDGDPGMLMRT